MTDATVQKLTSTDAFVIFDLPEAQRADGIVRCARKVLRDSTRSLARARTYAWAILGQQIGGASAGVNATGDGRAEALAAFAAELADQVAAGSLSLGAGKGVTSQDLSAIGSVTEPDPRAFTAGIIAAAVAALPDGSLNSKRVAIEFDGGAGEDLVTALGEAGADIVSSGPEALRTPADLLLFGSKPGVVDHEVVAGLEVSLLVPTGSLAFTPRALAVAARRGIVVLPDFLTTAGELAARCGLDPTDSLTERTKMILSHDDGPVLGACLLAEEFLSGWVDELPFGRPIG